MMNLLQLLGNNLLWAGSEDSLKALEVMLSPERFDAMMREAMIERQDWVNRRAKRVSDQQARVAKVQAQLGAAMAGVDFKVTYGDDEDDDKEQDYSFHSATYKVDGSTAVVGIKGSLVNSDKWYLRYMGQVGYPHIIDQLVRAYNDPEVTNVVLDMNSPGGAVNGLGQVSDVIKAVSLSKPVTTFGDGQICSGGYWLASATENITTTDLTQTGSIGVIVTHIEYSRAMEKEGVTATVLREGKYKALVSPYEPLSKDAEAEVRKSMAVIYQAFLTQVSAGRNVSMEYADKTMGEGRTFWGADAKAVNLIDQVGDFSRAVAFSRHLADTRAGAATFSHQ